MKSRSIRWRITALIAVQVVLLLVMAAAVGLAVARGLGGAQDWINPLLLFGGFALVAVATLVLSAWVVLKHLLGPIQLLTVAAGDLAAGRAATVPAFESADDLGSLTKALEQWEETARDRLEIARSMLEVSGHADLQDVIKSGIKRLAQVVDATEVVLDLQEGDGRRVVASLGGEARLTMRTAAAAGHQEPQTGRAQMTQAADLITALDPEDYAYASRFGPMLTVPMFTGGEVVGTIGCLRPRGDKPFTRYDADRAEIMVPFIAAAVRAARVDRFLQVQTGDLAGA